MPVPVFDGDAIDLNVSKDKYWGGGIVADLNGGFTTYSINAVLRHGPQYVSTQTRMVDSVSHELGAATPVAVNPDARADFFDMDRLSDGNLVMSWQSYSQASASTETFFKVFNAAGHAVTGTAVGNPPHPGNGGFQAGGMTALSTGGFVNAWSQYKNGSYDSFFQVFAADGTVTSPTVRINPTLAGDQQVVDTTALQNGSFLQVWIDEMQVFGPAPLVGRVFSAAGVALTKAFDIAAAQEGQAFRDPAATVLTDGDIAVAWRVTDDQGLLPDALNVRVFHANGKPASLELTVDAAAASGMDGGGLDAPSVVALQDGRWMVAWTDREYDIATSTPHSTLMGQIFKDDGSPDGEFFDLGPGHGVAQDPRLAALVDGRIAVYYNDHPDQNLRSDALVQIIDPRLSAINLTGSAAGDQFVGTAFADTVDGGNGRDKIAGSAGDDLLTGGAQGDSLMGGDGNDMLAGGSDNDLLLGGSGDDVLTGGLGDDMLTGGLGRDSFVFASGGGHDRITDFRLGQDKLNLHAFHFASASEALSHVTQTADGATLTMGSDTVLLLAIAAADLDGTALTL